MPVPEFRRRTFEDVVRVMDEMGSGTGVSNLMKECGLSEQEAHQYLSNLHAQGTFRYFASEQEDGSKEGYKID